MTPKPPEGFDGWLGWCVQNAEYRDLWIERNCPMGGEQPHYMEEAAQAELASLRSRVAELEREMEKEVELRMHCIRIGQEAARREAKKIAELEQWKESAMRVLGEHHGALQRHGTLGESTADCMDRLARQVAALADALRHAVQRNHSPSDGCNGCVGIYEALRAAGRKT